MYEDLPDEVHAALAGGRAKQQPIAERAAAPAAVPAARSAAPATYVPELALAEADLGEDLDEDEPYLAPPVGHEDEDLILRFTKPEIRLHWSFAAPFVICFITALILILVYNPSPQRPYREAFSYLHRLSGVCLFTGPAIVFYLHRRDWHIYWSNIREAWTWKKDDIRWLFMMGPATFNPKIELPPQGKYNAAEKLNFMTMMWAIPTFAVTGVAIWLPGVAFWAWVVHYGLAVLITPLLIGHIYMATTNADTRVGLSGMFSGWVDREWASHHYTRWYNENFEPGSLYPSGLGLVEPPAPPETEFHDEADPDPDPEPAVDADRPDLELWEELRKRLD